MPTGRTLACTALYRMTGGTGTIGLVDSAREENLNRTQDLIIHDPAHRGANGAAMPTDEDDQDGNFFFNHPERGGLFCLGARSHCYCCLDPIPPTEGVRAVAQRAAEIAERRAVFDANNSN